MDELEDTVGEGFEDRVMPAIGWGTRGALGMSR